MMEVEINSEIKDIRYEISQMYHMIDKMTVNVEYLVKENEEAKNQISKFKKFKNKTIGILGALNTGTVILISVIAIII